MSRPAASAAATVSVHRLAGYLDRSDPYIVLVDGAAAAVLANGERRTIAVPPGRHEVEVRFRLWGSRRVTVWLADGDRIALRCGNPLSRWSVLLLPFVMLLRPRRYIGLET